VTDSAGSHDVSFVQGTFTKPPHCTCSSVTTAAAACISSTGATADHVVVGSFTATGAAAATDVTILCVGE